MKKTLIKLSLKFKATKFAYKFSNITSGCDLFYLTISGKLPANLISCHISCPDKIHLCFNLYTGLAGLFMPEGLDKRDINLLYGLVSLDKLDLTDFLIISCWNNASICNDLECS